MEQQKVFATAMLGFDKKAVLDYIYELDCTAKKKDEEQQRRTEEYERQLEQLRQELEESESQRQELEQQHLQAQEELEELKEICQRLREQNGRQEQELRHREKEIQIQAEQNRQLQNKNAEQESKLRIYKVALSLALGLADTISESSGGIELNTMLIDEGFGSLDSESLDAAINCLYSLRADGRYIGIISHVNELKERIPQQIRVIPGINGSTIEEDAL